MVINQNIEMKWKNATPLGPGGLLAAPPTAPGKFEIDGETKSKYSEKSAKYSAKSTLLSQK